MRKPIYLSFLVAVLGVALFRSKYIALTRFVPLLAREQEKEKPTILAPIPFNIHRQYPLDCGTHFNESRFDQSIVHPATASLIDIAFKHNGHYWWTGHRPLTGTPQQAAKQLARVQSCLYKTLDYFWKLAKEHKMTRWAAHGGTAMATYCHHSANPWDDDIDITVSKCEPLDKLWEKAGNVSAKYPKIPINQIERKGVFHGRLLNDNWILFQGNRNGKRVNNWYKLKPVSLTLAIQTGDLSGMDIMCFDEGISGDEIVVMNTSGYREYLEESDEPLRKIEFGPTYMQSVPDEILKKYVKERYGKELFCDFPFDKTGSNNRQFAPSSTLPPRASQMEFAVSKWYTSQRQRRAWLNRVDNVTGDELTRNEVPNLNVVEIDNTIARPLDCKIGILQRRSSMSVVVFNAARGKHWEEFADTIISMKELKRPDVILLNEMDIGMARSGNIHTTRKLAFQLGMNYAWGLEFIELTSGSEKEQIDTNGTEDALGLHGNAILSTCALYDPIIIRDKLDDIYFSSKVSWINANGFEKRLGGRMGLYARLTSQAKNADGKKMHLVVGSIHKLNAMKKRSEIWKYQFGIPQSKVPGNPSSNQLGVVVAGDFGKEVCAFSGLANLDQIDPVVATFPASCDKNKTGGWRGDNICGNMDTVERDRVFLPCHISNGTTTQLSDHSILQINLIVP